MVSTDPGEIMFVVRQSLLETDSLESPATQEQLIVNDVSGHQRIINKTRSIVS